MTIRPMYRCAAAGLVLIALVGCGRDGGGDAEAAENQAAAQRQLDEALEAVGLLEEQVTELQERVDEVEARDDKTSKRMETISQRLWSSLAKVRESVSAAEGAGVDAASKASSALDQAAVAVRDLAVLEKRFDYHLRTDGD